MLLDNLQSFHFLRPWFLWGLVPMIVVVFLLRRRYVKTPWETVCDPHLLNHLLIHSKHTLGRWPWWIFWCSYSLVILALAGPSWEKITLPVYLTNQARVIALDVSTSMDVSDIKPTRLIRAKFKMIDLLKRQQEGQIGLVAFTSEPFVVSPLTKDSNTIAAMVPELKTEIMPVQGVRIDTALKKSAQLMQQAGYREGQIILITNNQATNTDLEAAEQLKQSGITTSVLGMGTEQGAPIPRAMGGFVMDDRGRMVLSRLSVDSLKQLAKAGGGYFVPFTYNDADIEKLIQSDAGLSLQRAQQSKEKINVWLDEGRWFLLPVLLFGLMVFRRGWFESI